MSDVLERFLRYVQYDTQSDERSPTCPSTAKQLRLLTDLAGELRALGLADAEVDEFGYVMATIPATTQKSDVPTIGFIAHVDTSPEMSGAGVKPIVHRGYDGRDLVLPDAPDTVIRLADTPALAEQLGNDIVTASGATLLGADDKAGVAEIVTAAAFLIQHPDIAHGRVRIDDQRGALSVVGAGINASFENVRRGSDALSAAGIAPAGVSTSSFRITWTIDRAKLDDAVRLMHRTFIEKSDLVP